MKKVFHFDSPTANYQSDAAVVWCFDNRFGTGFRKFLKRLAVLNADHIRVAGGAKSLASPETERERETVLDQIRKSMRLHATRRVILMVHSDCGAYGGLHAFHNDVKAEAKHHEEELHRAAKFLLQAIPEIGISGYFANFDGIWDAEIG